MRILADENFLGDAVAELRRRGHDVLWVRTEMPGAPDPEILRRAQAEQRIVVTFEKGFGDLAFHAGLPATCGIMLLRISLPPTAETVERIVGLLESRTDWAGHFTTVTDERIRMRPLPNLNDAST
jgi:predicted nuclease of predicted toxin-antitoxin system